VDAAGASDNTGARKRGKGKRKGAAGGTGATSLGGAFASRLTSVQGCWEALFCGTGTHVVTHRRRRGRQSRSTSHSVRDSAHTGLLGGFVWYRPGLCQCWFRIGWAGLHRAKSPNCIRLVLAAPPYRLKPAAQLLPIRPSAMGSTSVQLMSKAVLPVAECFWCPAGGGAGLLVTAGETPRVLRLVADALGFPEACMSAGKRDARIARQVRATSPPIQLQQMWQLRSHTYAASAWALSVVSRTSFCRPVPNPSVTIRHLCVAVHHPLSLSLVLSRSLSQGWHCRWRSGRRRPRVARRRQSPSDGMEAQFTRCGSRFIRCGPPSW
jgi:hypothetical protein